MPKANPHDIAALRDLLDANSGTSNRDVNTLKRTCHIKRPEHRPEPRTEPTAGIREEEVLETFKKKWLDEKGREPTAEEIVRFARQPDYRRAGASAGGAPVSKVNRSRRVVGWSSRCPTPAANRLRRDGRRHTTSRCPTEARPRSPGSRRSVPVQRRSLHVPRCRPL